MIHRIDLAAVDEAINRNRFAVFRLQRRNRIGIKRQVLSFGMLITRDEIIRHEFAMHRTLFRLPDALPAITMELIESDFRLRTGCRKRLHRDLQLADLQKPFPRGPCWHDKFLRRNIKGCRPWNRARSDRLPSYR